MWLRLYTDLLNDPKVQRLAPEHFKGWVNLFCLAKERDGLLPEIPTIACPLRIPHSQASELIEALQSAGLLDRHSDGLTPHNWEGRQYDSDGSAERMRRHRQKKRDAKVTNGDGHSDVTVTAQSRAEAETEAETEA